MWRRFRPMWFDVVISRTVFRHNAFSTKKITGKNFNIVHINKYVTWSIDKKISKISDIATITTFSIPPLFHQKSRHHPM